VATVAPRAPSAVRQPTHSIKLHEKGRREPMRFCRRAALFLILVLAPTAALQAQTTEIQEEVGIKLWLQRLLQTLGADGEPPVLLLLALAVGALVLFGALWLWKSRRKGDT
jgi:hypothetical protein